MQRRGLLLLAAYKDFRLVQAIADKPGHKCRNHAHQKHATPADVWQQQRREQGRAQYAHLPAQCHIRRYPGTVTRGPGLGRQCHANAEFAAQADAGQRAVDQQVPIALRKRAQAGEHGKHHNGPGEHTDASKPVAERTKHNAAHDGANQGPCHQGTRLCGRQAQVFPDGAQHETQN
ncbi:hypothetical protein D3C71_1380390 [compost metagenome]